MIELLLGCICCVVLPSALAMIGIFLQGILDYFEKGRKKKKSKRAKTAEKQQAEKTTMLIKWRQ